MELVIEPHHRTLAVEPGATLLDVLRDNGIPVSYSCMAGRCGTCRCKILAGSVLETGRETKPRGAVDGAADGEYVLACMSVLTESCTIELPEPDEIVTHPARIVKATVVSIEDMTRDILRLRLRPAKPLAFSPGQYAMLQFTPEHIRPYSMAGLCDDGELEFHVRQVPDGKVTGYIFDKLEPGASVRVSGPLGTAYLRRKHEGPMLCVAGGTGLAPVLSIVRGAVAAGMRNPIHVYFGVRTPDDVYGTRWLDKLAAEHDNVKVHIVVTSGSAPGLRTGLVTDAVVEDWDDLTGWRAYLCGAPPMVEAATLLVKRKGVKAEHVYADAFYASAA